MGNQGGMLPAGVEPVSRAREARMIVHYTTEAHAPSRAQHTRVEAMDKDLARTPNTGRSRSYALFV